VFFRETAALFLCFKTDDLVRVVNMYIGEDSLILFRINEVLSVTQGMNYNFT